MCDIIIIGFAAADTPNFGNRESPAPGLLEAVAMLALEKIPILYVRPAH